MKYIAVIPFCWVAPSKTSDWHMDFPPTRQYQSRWIIT